jgi:hypothetical protein
MEEKIHIYSDESNHDKSITNKENNINIDNEGLSREYVRSFLMIKTSCLDDAEEKLNNLEKRYFSCLEDEPKGKLLFQLTKKVGLKNLSGEATKFLLDLLDFIEEFEIQIFLVIFNKFEYIINNSIEVDIERLSKKLPTIEDKEIRYSFSKYFKNHYNERLRKVFFSRKDSQTDYKIKKAIYEMNSSLKQHKLKRKERLVGKSLYSLVDNGIVRFNTKATYKWDYTFESNVIIDIVEKVYKNKKIISFDKGTKVSTVFKELLVSKNITSIEVTEDLDSKEDIFIRLSDYFATFFGKLSRSYSNSFKLKDFETGKKNYSTVESIPQSWFELNETQFYLAKRIGELINNGSIFLLHGILADTPVGLKNYFQFIADFKEFSDYEAEDILTLSQFNNQRLSETWYTSYSEQGIIFLPDDATYGALSENFGKS